MKKIQICILALLLLSGCSALSGTESQVSLDANSQQQSEVSSAKDTIVTSSQPEKIATPTSDVAEKPVAPPTSETPSKQPSVLPESTSKEAEKPVAPPTSETPSKPPSVLPEFIPDGTKPTYPPIPETSPSKQPVIPPDVKFVPYDTASLPKLEEMMKQRKVKDLERFEITISNLEREIARNLSADSHNGVMKITLPYQTQEGYLRPAIIGVRVFYTDLEVTKAAVQASLQSIDPSIGEIAVEYQQCSYSAEQMWKLKKEITEQSFFDYEYDSIENKGGKIHIVMGIRRDTQPVKDFLRDKPYRDIVVIEKEEEKPYYKWIIGLRHERGISQTESHLFYREMNDLEDKLTEQLDKATYGGLGYVYEEFFDAETGDTRNERIGIRIRYVDADAVSAVVQQCWQETNHELGKIEIEYVKCSNSLAYLEQIASEIEQQFDGFSQYVLPGYGYGDKLRLYYRPDKSGDELRDFLSDKPYRDDVVVKRQPINPPY